MGDRTFRYELVGLDDGLWSRIKLFFTGKQSLIVYGKYFDQTKALKHLDQLHSQGKIVFLSDKKDQI